ncbi:MAG TPA: adenylate/guanylate cyclase domain-containing protein [Sphingomicrobium sp.]|nr:adenylate/guanylate cyclase domain-containing protein [Sphingomicrobium sp.]
MIALLRDLLEPAIEARGGSVIKKTGDGVLAEFASVVEAVRCALEIQREVASRNHASEQPIAFRIGINIGDVIVESDDIYGDSVNIAVRLESLAQPGGIMVSGAVRDHVHDKLKLHFEDMGELSVKNIERPVHAFSIAMVSSDSAKKGNVGRSRRGAVALATTLGIGIASAGGWWRLNYVDVQGPPAAASVKNGLATEESDRKGERLSIAVLPFTNLSGDPDKDYFVDGITESLTTDLSRALPGSFVVARGTAFTYKGRLAEGSQIARDLNIRYLLAGSVLPDGNRMRVNARLIDAETDTELWAERFDNRRENVLEVQDQIVGRLSRAIGLKLIDIEAKRSERHGNPSAVDFVMRAQAIANRPTSRETMIEARALFQEALGYDADNVDALAGVAMTYVFEVLNGYYHDGREQRLRDGHALIRRALELDSHHIVALKVHAALLRAEGKFEDAIAASRAVIAQNPGEPWAYKEVGLSELYLGHFQQAIEWFEKAEQIGPRDPSRWIWLGAMGRAQFSLDHIEEAIRLLRLSADANRNDFRAPAFLAAIYALSNRADEAALALAEALRVQPGITIKRLFDDWSVPLNATSPVYQQQHERIREGLRMAGMLAG